MVHAVSQAYPNLTVVSDSLLMTILQLITFLSLLTCLAFLSRHVVILLKNRKIQDYSQAAGAPSAGIRYSFTGAMNPAKKESAFLHLPTYTAGIMFHTGSFLSILLNIPLLLRIHIPLPYAYILVGILCLSSLSGFSILIKRAFHPILRPLSNPDDYLSNSLTSLFQALTAWVMVVPGLFPEFCIFSALFWLYFPLGKLKHAVYFFAARIQLGHFYGWRGVWPPKDH